MRKMLGAALIGLTVAGGAVIAGTAQAQPYGYYAPAPSGYYDSYVYYHSAPVYTAPSYGYTAPVYGYNGSDVAGLAGALIGSVIAPAYGAAVPVDRYGPDPNGMIAPDGHRIKCKLRNQWDNDYDSYRTIRECY